MQLVARADERVEGMGSEHAILVLQGGLEGGHRRVVGLVALRKDVVAELRDGLVAIVLDYYVA